MDQAVMKEAIEKAKKALVEGPLSEKQVEEIMQQVHNASARHYSAEQLLKRICSVSEGIDFVSCAMVQWWRDSEDELSKSPESVKPVLTAIRNNIWEQLRRKWFNTLDNGHIIDLDATTIVKGEDEIPY